MSRDWTLRLHTTDAAGLGEAGRALWGAEGAQSPRPGALEPTSASRSVGGAVLLSWRPQDNAVRTARKEVSGSESLVRALVTSLLRNPQK